MSDLYDLYQEMILDHSKRPRNQGEIEGVTNEAHGHNPLCGDQIHVTLILDGDVVQDVAFTGKGCAISTASSSLMTETVKGMTIAQIEELFEGFHSLVTGQNEPAHGDDLGKLAVFSGVSEFPMRVKCATLSWHTLRAAIDQTTDPVSTE